MYKLYWAPASAAMAPQAVLEEAGLPYEIAPVDLDKEENLEAPYLAINPAGYVPALQGAASGTLYESAAIVLYLCDQHALSDLAPVADDPLRGLFYRSLFYLTNTVQEAYKHFYYPERFSVNPGDAPRIKARAVELLVERWGPVEAQLQAGGPFLLGERFSACDIYLLMLVSWYRPPSELLARYPAIKLCCDKTAARPAVAKVLEAHGGL